MTFSPSKLWEEIPPIPFPTSGSKKDMIAWVINDKEREGRIKDRAVLRWEYAFIGQMIFWVTLFTTGKVALGWF